MVQVIAFDATSNSSTTGASPFQWNHTCTGANLALVVALVNTAGNDVTGVTYNGVAMTQVQKQSVFSGKEVYIYLLLNPATGSNQISVSKSGGNMSGAAASYTGVKQASGPDASTTNSSGAATTYAEALTSIADNCWHISAVFGDALNAISAGSNTSVRTHLETVSEIAIGDNNGAIHPAGSNTLNFAASSMSWASNGITLAPQPDTYTISPSTGTFALTGQSTTLSHARTFIVSYGTYALTGVSTTVTWFQKFINAVKDVASFSNSAKDSSSWNNSTKDVTTWTDQTKN